jgi:hypothetical protein
MIKNCRCAVLMTACSMGWLGGSHAFAVSSNEPQQQNIIIPQSHAISGGRPEMVSGQSLINLAAEIHSRSGVTNPSSFVSAPSRATDEAVKDAPLFWQDLNIASTLPKHSIHPDFNDPATQLTNDEINLVPVPPAIFTGALTLGGMMVVKGLKRLR